VLTLTNGGPYKGAISWVDFVVPRQGTVVDNVCGGTQFCMHTLTLEPGESRTLALGLRIDGPDLSGGKATVVAETLDRNKTNNTAAILINCTNCVPPPQPAGAPHQPPDAASSSGNPTSDPSAASSPSTVPSASTVPSVSPADRGGSIGPHLGATDVQSETESGWWLALAAVASLPLAAAVVAYRIRRRRGVVTVAVATSDDHTS
jgi:hypothetical protein